MSLGDATARTSQRFRRSTSGPVHARTDSWRWRYARTVRWADRAVVVAAVGVAQIVRFGTDPFAPAGALPIPGIVASAVLVVVWLCSLRITQSSDPRILGSGAAEYNRVIRASIAVFAVVAIVDLVANLSVARGYLAILLLSGLVGLLLVRYALRRVTMSRRMRGLDCDAILVVGEPRSVTPLIRRLNKEPRLGFEVVGTCLPVPSRSGPVLEVGERKVPVYGDFTMVREAIALSGARVVAVTSADLLGHSAMRELSWDLEGMNVEMLVAPGILDVAGPRLTMRPEAGLPLLHVDKPRYEGATRFVKLAFDKTLAFCAVAALFPVMIACALAVKFDSRGPVFYRGERVGLNNEPFRMWKFRSMVVDADALRADLATQSEGNGVLFKIRDDPRVTRVGKFMRRYSLDELPQLFNVLDGSMSLVGPRPPLREEVETYDVVVTRRMLVRPGITGLWQVSGRSDLDWEESVQLDLSYVENWTLAGDVIILWRTVRAVLAKDGAY